LDELAASVEAYRKDMIKEMQAMLRIPSMGPENGGQGEVERARHLEKVVRLCGFEDVKVYSSPDERVASGVRPNILARRKGRSDRTIWIVSHIDTVSAGDEKKWTYPPFDPQVVDGRIYGRGAEDDGQAVISSIFAARALLDTGLEPELSVGLVLVADEEAGSDHGIKFLIDQNLFGKDDLFYVPDSGDDKGSVIEVAEKSIVWLRITTKGKQVHASTPALGLNALTVGAEFMLFLRDHLYGKFNEEDPLFIPAASTFEPTKKPANVENINTIPGEDVVFFDARLLPRYDPQDVVETAQKLAKVFEERTGAKITVEGSRVDLAGPASSLETDGLAALKDAVKRVLGIEPAIIGVGGQTCSNWFRRAGWDAYVWQTVDETLHQVDEYTRIDSMVGDAKVFAVLLANLCYPGQFR